MDGDGTVHAVAVNGTSVRPGLNDLHDPRQHSGYEWWRATGSYGHADKCGDEDGVHGHERRTWTVHLRGGLLRHLQPESGTQRVQDLRAEEHSAQPERHTGYRHPARVRTA